MCEITVFTMVEVTLPLHSSDKSKSHSCQCNHGMSSFKYAPTTMHHGLQDQEKFTIGVRAMKVAAFALSGQPVTSVPSCLLTSTSVPPYTTTGPTVGLACRVWVCKQHHDQFMQLGNDSGSPKRIGNLVRRLVDRSDKNTITFPLLTFAPQKRSEKCTR
jgi:hypothetical protein